MSPTGHPLWTGKYIACCECPEEKRVGIQITLRRRVGQFPHSSPLSYNPKYIFISRLDSYTSSSHLDAGMQNI